MENPEYQNFQESLRQVWNKFTGKENIDENITPKFETSEINKVCDILFSE